MKITFYGAAQSVTGSKHLIEAGGLRILLDCGLHQGGYTMSDEANRVLPFDASTIDCVILSHAHADHCGMLPIMVKNGFKGKIYCTPATADIAKYILIDSAMVQEQDFKYIKEKLGFKHRAGSVMYTRDEAENTFPYFEPVPYFRLQPQWVQLNDSVRFKFYDAGHILGSAITYLEAKENGATKGLVYTGDIGQPGAPILHDPESVEENVDAIISEATYGSTNHRPLSDAAIQLKEAVEFAIARKSKIVVPAFALGRTQELVYIMHDLIKRGVVPEIPVYVDSPLGMNISEVFNKHLQDFDAQTKKDFGGKGELPLAFKNLRYVHTIEESKELNRMAGPFMVISSSGMMEGGRILHHLKNSLEDANNTVLITGYQAEYTLGRKLQNGAAQVQIYGVPLKVRARVITMNEFSAHADQAFLIQYIEHLRRLKQVFLVHTELLQARALQHALKSDHLGFKTIVPSLLESFEI